MLQSVCPQTAKSDVEADREVFDRTEVESLCETTLAALKPTLAAIDATIATCSNKQFKGHTLLVCLYAKVPPKKKGAVLARSLNRDCNEEMKKAVSKALKDYHPDKEYNKENGIEWFVLCKEITKR